MNLVSPLVLRGVRALLAVIVFLPLCRTAASQPGAGGTGIVVGIVSSLSTRNFLEGAVIELPTLNRRALTDRSGRFSFADVPAGVVEVRVSYLGFEPSTKAANV
jgi:hypothetical protein